MRNIECEKDSIIITTARIRRIVQVLFLFVFILLFIRARYPYEVDLSSDIFLRFSPIFPLFYLIENFSFSSVIIPGLVILFFTIFLGRFFCGWICPLGTTLDISDKFIKPPRNNRTEKLARWRWLKFAILTGLVVLALMSINIWGYFDPIAIFTRFTTVIFYPLATFF
ncbi:MAG: 4Fe-4S binding protein, partial [Calditrichaeota bacterium]|nr:4Fe-4S binding protein [Calditrichota bacterium]